MLDILLPVGNYSVGFGVTVHNVTGASAWFGNIAVYQSADCPSVDNLALDLSNTKYVKSDVTSQLLKGESRSPTLTLPCPSFIPMHIHVYRFHALIDQIKV